MKDGKEKPVFYTKDQEINYVGFTPHLRVCYDKTIKDGIKQEKISSDYCRAMLERYPITNRINQDCHFKMLQS